MGSRAIRRGIVSIGQDSAAPDFGWPHPSLPGTPVLRPYASGEDEHDPEKWVPVFGKDHAQTKS